MDWVNLEKKEVRLCVCVFGSCSQSYQRAESDDLENRFHEEEGGKHDVEVFQDVIVFWRRTVKLETKKMLLSPQTV